MTTPADFVTAIARRNRLRRAIARMFAAIAKGELAPAPCELDALARVCDDHFLPVEAARVRRWMTP